MTFLTFDVGVAPGQGEVRLVVVEGGRDPSGNVVAIAAVSFGIFGHELTVVSVLVTGFALLGCALEA